MIRLAIIDEDKLFLNKISVYFTNKYGHEMTINTYSRYDLLEADLAIKRFDVVWGSRNLSGLSDKVRQGKGFSYIVDQKNISSIDGIPGICKYQKTDVIYRKILSIYSDLEKAAGIVFGPDSTSETKVTIVQGLIGGVGTTSVAIALGKKLIQEGQRVFYLNVNSFSNPDVFLNAQGDFGLSDVFYSIKSKKGNIGLKIKSVVKEDRSKLAYFDTWQSPLDYYNIETSDIFDLIKELAKTNSYDYIILDSAINFSNQWLDFLNKVSEIVIVSDQSEQSQQNLKKVIEIVHLFEQQDVVDLTGKLRLFYNHSSAQMNQHAQYKVLGNATHLSSATNDQSLQHVEKNIQLKDF